MKLFTPTSSRPRARMLRSKRGLPLMTMPGDRPGERRGGVALVMVLVLTTVLGALAADLQNEASVNVQLARNARDQLQAEFHAKSALELELFLLRFQAILKNALSSFVPVPLFELSGYLVSSDTMKGLLTERKDRPTDDRVQANWASDQKFGDFEGSFWIEEVVDENRKININRPPTTQCLNMVHVVLAGLFNDPKYDPLFETLSDSRDPIRNRLELIANITDWVDGNENVDTVCTITGDSSQSSVSEDLRYRNFPYGATYKPKNGQFTSLAELRMVPGVNDVVMRLFAPHLTVWTDDTGINVNTADPIILRAIIRAMQPGGPQPGDDEKFAKFMEELALTRILPPPLNKLDKTRLTQLLEAAQIRVDAGIFNQLESQRLLRFDDASNVYRITAMGRVGETVSTITAVWRDDRAQGEIRYYHQE